MHACAEYACSRRGLGLKYKFLDKLQPPKLKYGVSCYYTLKFSITKLWCSNFDSVKIGPSILQ